MNRVICEECETVKHCMQNGCIPKVPQKPVVYFTGKPDFWMWNATNEVASLQLVVNHPRLGWCSDVRTSTVLHKFPDGSFETRNTIYKPMAQEDMGS